MYDLYDTFDERGQIKDEVVEDLMIEVASGRAVFEYEEDIYATRQPTLTEQDRGRIVYRRMIQRATSMGCPTRLKLESDSLDQGLLDPEVRSEKEHLVANTKRIVGLREKSSDPTQKLQIDQQIATARQRLEEIELQEYEVMQHCREEKAERARQFFYVSCCTLGGLMLDEPMWEDYESFGQCHDVPFILAARRALSRVSLGLPTKVIRGLARHHDWRARWKASKESGTQPFDGASSTWDKNKVGLIYWSDFYDSIHAHPESPSDDVIADDDSLQAWINQQIAKRKAVGGGSNGGGRPVTYVAGGQRRTMTKVGEKRINVNTPVKVRT